VNLFRQQLDELSIGLSEGPTGFAEQFGDVASRDFDADHVLEEISNPAVGSMDFTLEIDGQAGQSRPEQTRLGDVLGQGGLVIATAVLAPNAVRRILDHPEGFFDQLDLLDGALVLRSLRGGNPVGGINRTLLEAKGDPLIDLIGSKGGPLVFGMSLWPPMRRLDFFFGR